MDFRIFFVIFLVVNIVLAGLSPCYISDQTWLSTDILDTVQHVADHQECQKICAESPSCQAFTWTSEEYLQSKLFCFLFLTTYNFTSCDGCISGPASCTCSSQYACDADEDNVLDVVNGVTEEVHCQDLCAENKSCSFYTWYDETNFPAITCFLLANCEVWETDCSGCYSGPPVCSGYTTTTTTTTTTPTSTTTTTDMNDVQCSNPYSELSDDWRHISYNPGGDSFCQQNCDNQITSGWYRFVDPAGVSIPTSPPQSSGNPCDVCQTDVAAWILEKRNPVLGEGIMDLTLCFALAEDECYFSNTGKAVACQDDEGAIYYLYYLNHTNYCDLAYCAL